MTSVGWGRTSVGRVNREDGTSVGWVEWGHQWGVLNEGNGTSVVGHQGVGGGGGDISWGEARKKCIHIGPAQTAVIVCSAILPTDPN